MELAKRTQQLEIDDLMARSTFGNLLKAAKRGARGILGPGTEGVFLVVTEAGQTNVYSRKAAESVAKVFADELGFTALVVQIISATAPNKAQPAPESGEPPDGRTA